MTPSLLQKYNIAAPRYTSYPTVPYWQQEKPSETAWIDTVQTAFQDNRAISLYIHLPYCESLCTYCGCNKRITKNHQVETPYIQTVLKEWALYLKVLPDRPIIKELHLGGGTPTFFSAESLNYLLDGIFEHADIAEEHSFSFEAHPWSTTDSHLIALKNKGFNRISLGVQDFDPKILKVINRRQTYEQVQDITHKAQMLGYESINYDFIFGLPLQNKTNIYRNIANVQALRPNRIAFYSYAHVPWIYPGQRAYSEADIPTGEAKRELYELGKELLLDLGYGEIGFDHFALPSDALYVAHQNKRLHRSFMGYTPFGTPLNVALGVSAISDSWGAFVQNEKKIKDYKNRVEEGELPFFRGHLLSRTDQILRRHILNLTCNFETDWMDENLVCDELYDAFDRLDELEADGLVRRKPFQLKVTDLGKPFIRNICLALDEYYWAKRPEKALFSQVV
ncbi:MAG: oxygen-independent coproporphyrinogen III oxidase [Bacteroidota bacterium]